jgi:hypothetical protein
MAFLQLFVTTSPSEEIQGRWVRTPEGEWIAVISFKDTGDYPAVFISIDHSQLVELINFLIKLLEQYEQYRKIADEKPSPQTPITPPSNPPTTPA